MDAKRAREVEASIGRSVRLREVPNCLDRDRRGLRTGIGSLDLPAGARSSLFEPAPAGISAPRGWPVPAGAEKPPRAKKRATFQLFATLLMPSGGRQERALRRIAKSALRAEILVRKRKVGSGFFEVDRVGFLAKRPNSGSEPAQGHFRPAPHGTFGTFANPRTRASTSSPAVTPKSA